MNLPTMYPPPVWYTTWLSVQAYMGDASIHVLAPSRLICHDPRMASPIAVKRWKSGSFPGHEPDNELNFTVDRRRALAFYTVVKQGVGCPTASSKDHAPS